ncbi:MAG: hypothetical protein ABIH37_03660 [archaeon]
MKKGQTTIFIIIAIVIIVIAVFFVVLQQSKTNKFFSASENQVLINNLKTQVNYCIETSIMTSLEKIGDQGGYFEKPDYAYQNESISVSFLTYYYFEDKILNPSKQQIETELEKAFDSELKRCTDLVSIEGLNLKFRLLNPNVLINKNQVLFNPSLEVNIKSQRYAMNLNFNQEITKDSSLSDMIDLALFISQYRKENPGFDCISCLAELSEEKNLYTEVYNFDESSVLVTIYENYTLNEQYLVFLNKYGDENE